MQIKDPLTITPEEDEEQMIMRRLRNSCDELKRGYRYVQKVENRKEKKSFETVTLAC